jgi:hypothetical protein
LSENPLIEVGDATNVKTKPYRGHTIRVYGYVVTSMGRRQVRTGVDISIADRRPQQFSAAREKWPTLREPYEYACGVINFQYEVQAIRLLASAGIFPDGGPLSTTITKTNLADAIAEAQAFRDSFPRDTYERWEIAGSIRRHRPEVGDIEHVVIPAFGIALGDGLFGERTNLLFRELDRRVACGNLRKHLYGGKSPRWGELYRGVDVPWLYSGGTLHEFFCADAANWGSVLAIRTGPAEQNPRLMNGLRTNGLRHYQGRVWLCEPCASCCAPGDGGPIADCPVCKGTGDRLVSPVATPDERTLFELAGFPYVEPRRRR